MDENKFKNYGFLRKLGLTVCLCVCTLSLFAQGFKVSGTVTDTQGESVIGASVAEKGTTNGIITDIEGKFTLQVASNATLVVSYIGYNTQEVAVANRTTIAITLIENTQALDEVVVVGYGTQRKSDLTSAIAKVSGTTLEARPVARVDQALQGQMAGVHVQQSGAKPGKKAVIRVRGESSITSGNDPLYVVDGFPVDADVFSNMSMSDIESVEVLKDAASASIYGSRGSGGVVIITTKRGVKGKEMKVDFNASAGVSNIERYINFFSPAEHLIFMADGYDDAFLQQGGNLSVDPMSRPAGLRYPADLVNLARTNPSAVPSWNPLGQLMRTGVDQNYQLNLSGATNKARYMISANYFDQQGIVKNTDYKRYAFRANVDVDVNKYLTVGLNLAPSFVVTHDKDTEGKQETINNADMSAQFIDPRTGYWGESDPITAYGVSNSAYLALAKIEQLKDEQDRAQMLADVYAQLNFGGGFSFKSSFGAVYISTKRDRFSNQILARTGKPSGENWDNQGLNILNENILNFSRTFAAKHAVSAMAGFTIQKQKYKNAYIAGQNFANDLVPTLNAASSWSGNTTMTENALLSYLGRVNYAYADKYLFSASVRRDGSSRFGVNTKWGIFPAFSAGWRVDQEEFWQSIETVNRLKLRANWGKTGNDNIGDYASIPTLENRTYLTGMSETINIGMRPANIANPNLNWETTATIDIGVDLGLLDNRVSLAVDYYNSLTSDLLLSVPIPRITGSGSEMQNIGEVENKGWEFELQTVNINYNDFTWTSNLNLSFNHNEVIKLGPGNAPVYGGDWYDDAITITTVGHPIGSFYLLKQTGVYKNQAEVDADPARRANARPGDVIVEDYNKDNVIDNNDRQIFGSHIPKYNWGFTNQFTYKGIDLSIFLNGVGGNKIFATQGRWFNTAGSQGMPHYAGWENRWKSEADPGDGIHPRSSAAPTGLSGGYLSTYLSDGSYIRLKNITLGYTLPSNLTRRVGVSRLRVYASVDNLAIWDHYDIGYTPEVDLSNGSATSGGRDYGVYPSARTVIFGLNVSF
jgi:TonB-linked SusC/RagA family outer membrane protein